MSGAAFVIGGHGHDAAADIYLTIAPAPASFHHLRGRPSFRTRALRTSASASTARRLVASLYGGQGALHPELFSGPFVVIDGLDAVRSSSASSRYLMAHSPS